MKNSIEYTVKNLPILEKQINEMIKNKKSLIKSYELFPSVSLQDKIINLGKKIGTANSIILELKTFGKILN